VEEPEPSAVSSVILGFSVRCSTARILNIIEESGDEIVAVTFYTVEDYFGITPDAISRGMDSRWFRSGAALDSVQKRTKLGRVRKASAESG
jgi:hypothetical protein